MPGSSLRWDGGPYLYLRRVLRCLGYAPAASGARSALWYVVRLVHGARLRRLPFRTERTEPGVRLQCAFHRARVRDARSGPNRPAGAGGPVTYVSLSRRLLSPGAQAPKACPRGRVAACQRHDASTPAARRAPRARLQI